MRVAASEMRELEDEDVESRRKMSEVREVYYKSLELKREAPNTTRPAAMKIKEQFRDLSDEDNERDLGKHVLNCELNSRNLPS